MARETQLVNDRTKFAYLGAATWVLAACAAPPPAAAPASDASYDWHMLVTVPFGTLLKAVPVGLHEVLLFHDPAQAAAPGEERDCYTVDGPAPRFTGRRPQVYLLCFEHDRLDRIDASVRIAAAEAEEVFARACVAWQRNSTLVSRTDTLCEGRAGGIAFQARLAEVPGESTDLLSMTLSTAP